MRVAQQLGSTNSAIRMGELAVSINDGVLRTLLGSCIGLALYDHTHKVGGLAHIVLPQSRDPGGPAGKFVNTAIPASNSTSIRSTIAKSRTCRLISIVLGLAVNLVCGCRGPRKVSSAGCRRNRKRAGESA